MIKRIFDILGSLAGLLFMAPITPFIGLAIVLESGLPIFVKLDRISSGRVIQVYKFRSMIQKAHELKPRLQNFNERRDGPFFKIAQDPRVTKVGRLLRKTRIDEFPQFWNVLKGDLALVGPRPHEPEEVAAYPEAFHSLGFAKAGLTGLSQVKGASALPFLKELEHDLYYIKNQSISLDCKILFETARIFFSDPTGV